MSDDRSGRPSGGTGLWTAGAVIAILLAAGWFLSQRDTTRLSDMDVSNVIAPNQTVTSATRAQEGQEGQENSAAPESSDAPNADLPITATTEPNVAVDPVAPTVDEVRIDAGGTIVVAGRAEPGSSVDILLDGEVVGTADADAEGAFAAISNVPEDDGARSLSLRSGDGDEVVSSREEIIIAPVGAAIAPVIADVDDAKSDAIAKDETAQVPQAETDQPSERPDGVASVAADTLDQEVATLEAEQSAETPQTSRALTEIAEENTATVDPENQATEGALTTELPASTSVDSDGAEPVTTAQQAETSGATTRDIALLRSDETGVTLLQTAPAPTSRIVLDTIGYTDDGVVQLAGRASDSAQQIRVYLNNRSVAQLAVDQDGGWQGIVPDVDPGVYTLRLDALSQDGSVASRLETPFKREAPSVLAAATQDVDASGTVQAVTVQAGDTLWAIARERYGDGVLYVQVFEANRRAIRDPNLIYPGQVFDLPNE
ncbi:MAG: LysM peptidoglycan-binding domain-containing protein [Roseobacter sp.]